MQLAVTQLDVVSSTPLLESEAVELSSAIKEEFHRVTSISLEQLSESLCNILPRRNLFKGDHPIQNREY